MKKTMICCLNIRCGFTLIGSKAKLYPIPHLIVYNIILVDIFWRPSLLDHRIYNHRLRAYMPQDPIRAGYNDNLCNAWNTIDASLFGKHS